MSDRKAYQAEQYRKRKAIGARPAENPERKKQREKLYREANPKVEYSIQVSRASDLSVAMEKARADLKKQDLRLTAYVRKALEAQLVKDGYMDEDEAHSLFPDLDILWEVTDSSGHILERFADPYRAAEIAVRDLRLGRGVRMLAASAEDNLSALDRFDP